MKTQTKKLLFILILVVSIMAILIAAYQIYDIIANDKIIDNDINGIDGEDNTYDEDEEELFNELNPKYGVNWDPIGGTHVTFPYTYYSNWFNFGVPGQQFRLVFDVQAAFITRNMTLNSHIKEETLDSEVTYKIDFNMLDHDNTTDEITSTPIPCTAENFQNIIFQDSENANINFSNIEEYLTENFNIIGFDYSYNYKTDRFSFTISCINYISITAEQRINDTPQDNTDYGTVSMIDRNPLITATTYGVESNANSYGTSPKYTLESNELLLTQSRTADDKSLFEYNYEQIIQDWSNGKETATIKCSIGEYYQYDDTKPNKKGDLAISTQNNALPMIFDINDTVVPYIATANGQTEPLSLTIDGKPKVFKVTQIRPYFDGAFWQELQLQEVSDRYIQPIVFTSGTDGNATAGYIAQNQTVVVTKGKIVSVSLNYSTEDINTAQVSPTVSINEADNSFTIANVNLVSPNSTANIYATVIHEI